MSYPVPPPPPLPPVTTDEARQRKRMKIIGIVAAVVVLLCIGLVVKAVKGDDGNDPSSADPGEKTTTTTVAPEETETTPEIEEIKVPDLVGENAAVAMDELKRLGFTNIQFGSADEDDTIVIMAANWTVVEQSAKPGKKLAADALIVLTCSKKR